MSLSHVVNTAKSKNANKRLEILLSLLTVITGITNTSYTTKQITTLDQWLHSLTWHMYVSCCKTLQLPKEGEGGRWVNMTLLCRTHWGNENSILSRVVHEAVWWLSGGAAIPGGWTRREGRAEEGTHKASQEHAAQVTLCNTGCPLRWECRGTTLCTARPQPIHKHTWAHKSCFDASHQQHWGMSQVTLESLQRLCS